MRVAYEGPLYVHYGQAYIQGENEDLLADLSLSLHGQENGLCGALIPGNLFLLTALHTGPVGFRIEEHSSEPELPDEWEDVVELSFVPAGDDTALVQWAGEASFPLGLSRRGYRARYSCSNTDAARQADSIALGDPPIDRYLLQFWPDELPRPDAIIRQTSSFAAYCHRMAQQRR